MTPVIGITTYFKTEPERYSLPAAYVAAVRRAGGLPVLLPPGEPRLADLLDKMDGLILAGGGDIDPQLYGGKLHPALYMVDRARDEAEIALVNSAMEKRR